MGLLSWLSHCIVSPSEKARREVFAAAAPNLDAVAEGIKSGKYRNIIVMCGAGVSVSASIPDFRSRTGMYDMSKRFSLPNPWAVFDIGYFNSNAVPFYYIVRQLIIGRDGTFAEFFPTPTHCFFALLERKGVLLRCYTQNVDCLERCAGVSTKRLIQMHGTMADAHCVSCKARVPIRQIGAALWGDRPGLPPAATAAATTHAPRLVASRDQTYTGDDGVTWSVPHCTKCGGAVKPDVVLFNEGIPFRNLASAATDFPRCDLLLCFGSTFKVLPFANFIGAVDDLAPRVLFNLEMVGRAEDDGPLRSSKVCFRFTEPDNYRDVFVEGPCDDNVLELCKRLGWDAELRDLMAAAAKHPISMHKLEELQDERTAAS